MRPNDSSRMAFSDDVRIARPEHTYDKLRGRNLWVMNPAAAAKFISETYAPGKTRRVVYIATGDEERVLENLLRENIPVVLTGPPGIGKTTLIQSVFERLKLPLQTFVASAATQVFELLGREMTSGESGDMPIWQDGRLSLAARAAVGGVESGFYLDELIRLPAVLSSSLYSIIDARQTLYLPTGEELHLGGRLKPVFSYNPCRHTRLDDALRSRLTTIRLGYPPAAVEERILQEPSIGRLGALTNGGELAKGLVRFANVLRRALGYEVEATIDHFGESELRLLRMIPSPPSTRSLIVAARMILAGDYGASEAIKSFLVPSMIQDLHDHDLPELMHLLKRLVEDQIGMHEEAPAAFSSGDRMFDQRPGETLADALERQIAMERSAQRALRGLRP
jgi:MoxR-like ATPase